MKCTAARLVLALGFGLGLAVLGLGSAHAVRVQGLYEAEVPVQDQTPAARKTALRQALARVLVKVTGDREAPRRSELAPLLDRAAGLTQQYRYRTQPAEPALTDESKASREPSLGPAPLRATPQPRLVLWVQFDAGAVNQWLREHAQAVWPAERPAVLLWLAVREGRDRFLLSPESPEALREALREAARSRGLPLVLPLGDLTDRNRLAFSDVWGGFVEQIRDASDRYDPDAILVGRLAPEGAGWKGRWTLLHGEETARWESTAERRTVAARRGIQHSADVLASRLALAAAKAAPVPVEVAVTQVKDLAGYARVADYLAALSSVRDTQILEVTPDRVVLRVRVRGGVQALEEAITLGDMLAAEPAAPSSPATSSDRLHYRLLP